MNWACNSIITYKFHYSFEQAENVQSGKFMQVIVGLYIQCRNFCDRS